MRISLMQDAPIDDRLRNWAGWARDRNVIPVSCKSFECRYRPPPMYDYPDLKVDTDLNDALLIEHTITAQTFPKKAMAIIVYVHVYPWLNFQGALRKINRFGGKFCKPANFDDMKSEAELFLRNRLTR